MSRSADDEGTCGRLAVYMQPIKTPLATALLFALVSTFSFGIAYHLSSLLTQPPGTQMIGALWAMVSAIVVTQDTRSATISTAWLRIFGSLVGAVFAAMYLIVFPFSIAGMGLLVGTVVLVCGFLKMPDHLRLAALTAGIVLVVSTLNPSVPPLANAATRFLEVLIGSTVAVAASWVWQYVFGSD